MLLALTSVAQPNAEPAAPGFEHRTGVKISFGVHDDMFPVSWHTERINARARPLDTTEYMRSLEILSAALSKYPDSLLRQDLDEIYVVQSLEFFGASYGGTYTGKVVYLSNKGARMHYTHAYIERVFHAEFSSVLMKRYPRSFDEKAWLRANARDFRYGEGGMRALKDGKSSENFVAEHHELGFLNQYAQSSLENDFNAMVKNLFMPNPGFWEVTDRYEGLRIKRDLAIAFYHDIDPMFNEAWFRAFASAE